jgi:hypothetical protein
MNTTTSSSGVGFFGLLTIAFIILKLTNVIHWSWWWVTCPLWGSLAVSLAIILAALVFWVGMAGLLWLLAWRMRRQKK